MNPLLSKEWDPQRNGDPTPGMVTLGSDYKAWWICEKGHSYQSTVSNRVAGKGFPVCSGHKIISGMKRYAPIEIKRFLCYIGQNMISHVGWAILYEIFL